MTADIPPPDPAARVAPPAGWYPHPTMANTLQYWDGQQWTAHIAPASQPAQAPAPVAVVRGGGTNPLMVALGIIIAIAVIWYVLNIAAAVMG